MSTGPLSIAPVPAIPQANTVLDILNDVFNSPPSTGLSLSPIGEAFLKDGEKLRLRAYDDGFGNLTIGWGHTGNDVTPGMKITEQQAQALFERDVGHVATAIERNVDAPLSQSQFDTLISFGFNTGTGTIPKIAKKLNAGDYEGALTKMGQYTRAGGKSGVLKNRRAAEAQLWNGAWSPDGTQTAGPSSLSRSQVRTVQKALNAAGFVDANGEKLTVDGVMGAKTNEAIQTALGSVGTITADSPREQVRAVQAAMNASGITDKNGDPLRVDGRLGPMTQSAIERVAGFGAPAAVSSVFDAATPIVSTGPLLRPSVGQTPSAKVVPPVAATGQTVPSQVPITGAQASTTAPPVGIVEAARQILGPAAISDPQATSAPSPGGYSEAPPISVQQRVDPGISGMDIAREISMQRARQAPPTVNFMGGAEALAQKKAEAVSYAARQIALHPDQADAILAPLEKTGLVPPRSAPAPAPAPIPVAASGLTGQNAFTAPSPFAASGMVGQNAFSPAPSIAATGMTQAPPIPSYDPLSSIHTPNDHPITLGTGTHGVDEVPQNTPDIVTKPGQTPDFSEHYGSEAPKPDTARQLWDAIQGIAPISYSPSQPETTAQRAIDMLAGQPSMDDQGNKYDVLARAGSVSAPPITAPTPSILSTPGGPTSAPAPSTSLQEDRATRERVIRTPTVSIHNLNQLAPPIEQPANLTIGSVNPAGYAPVAAPPPASLSGKVAARPAAPAGAAAIPNTPLPKVVTQAPAPKPQKQDGEDPVLAMIDKFSSHPMDAIKALPPERQKDLYSFYSGLSTEQRTMLQTDPKGLYKSLAPTEQSKLKTLFGVSGASAAPAIAPPPAAPPQKFYLDPMSIYYGGGPNPNGGSNGSNNGPGNSYGPGGYQGGTYGGAGGRSINEGVGGAYKNR